LSIEVRVGRGLEGFLLERLRRAEKRLYVVSPWVSKEYVDVLLEAKSRGVDVKLITTDDLIPAHREALKMLLTPRRELVRRGSRTARVVGLVLILLGLIAAVPTAGLGLVIALAGAVVLIARGLDRYRVRYVSQLGDGLVVYSSRPGRTIHAKIYVVDDAVAIESANLTAAALRENFEALCWIRDPKIVEEVVRALESIEGFRRADLDTIGREVWKAESRRRPRQRF